MCRSLIVSLLSVVVFSAPLAQAATDREWQSAYIDQNLSQTLPGVASPAGFKAGLTSLLSRQRFHSDRAVFGNLPSGSVLDGGAVSLADFGKGMLEMELAFQLRDVQRQPMDSVAELKSKLSRVALALELPDLSRIPAPLSALNIVRGNVAAHYFAVAAGVPLSADIGRLELELTKDGAPVIEAPAEALAEGQWQTLLALINQRIALGWEIRPDQWLLTGALGGMQPLERGHYRLRAHCQLRAQCLPPLSLTVHP